MKKQPRLIVAGVIKKNNKYLLVKELVESNKEYWLIPGGGVEFGERLEDAVIREIKEELGVEAKVEKFLDFVEAVFPAVGYHTVIFFYAVKINSDQLKLEDKIIEANYFSAKQLKEIELVDSAQKLFSKMGII